MHTVTAQSRLHEALQERQAHKDTIEACERQIAEAMHEQQQAIKKAKKAVEKLNNEIFGLVRCSNNHVICGGFEAYVSPVAGYWVDPKLRLTVRPLS